MYNRFEDPRHIKWAKEVKERDCFECQICGESGKYLNSHHCNSYDIFVDERFIIENGRTMCSSCHHRFHQIYNCTKNTKFQYEEFKQFFYIINKIARKI